MYLRMKLIKFINEKRKLNLLFGKCTCLEIIILSICGGKSIVSIKFLSIISSKAHNIHLLVETEKHKKESTLLPNHTAGS